MGDGLLDPEQVGIEIPLGNMPADLPLESRVELILCDGFQEAGFIQLDRVLRIESHIERLCGDNDLVHLFPRPFEVRTSRLNDSELWIIVELFLLRGKPLCNRGISCHGGANAFCPSEASLHRPFVLIHRIETSDQIANHKPSHETDNTAKNDGAHGRGGRRISLSTGHCRKVNAWHYPSSYFTTVN